MHDTLIGRMDELASELLATAASTPGLEDKLAVVKAVGQWVAIKHAIRAGDTGERGDLAENRGKLRGSGSGKPKRRGFQDDTPEQQRARILRRWHPGKPASIDGDGAPQLEALKARLPKSSDV